MDNLIVTAVSHVAILIQLSLEEAHTGVLIHAKALIYVVWDELQKSILSMTTDNIGGTHGE